MSRPDIAPLETRTVEQGPPLIVGVSPEAVSTLALFRATDDGGQTELLLLDRAGDTPVRWTLTYRLGGQLLFGELPVRQLVEPCFDVIGPAVLVVEIICVFPYVTGQQAFDALRHRRIGV